MLQRVTNFATCFAALLALPCLLLYAQQHSRIIRHGDVNWSNTAVATSPPWAQPVAHLTVTKVEVEAAPRLKWPIRPTPPGSCRPGGSIVLAEGNLSDRKSHNLQHGTQLHLDGTGCIDAHLDAGTCVAMSGGLRCMPILVIPGAQKSGTGTLRDFLLHHENLQSGSGFSTHGKEINFFNSRRSIEEYLQVFPKVKDNGAYATRFFFDKSPNYMSGNADTTFGRMYSLAPSMAIVIILRNPTDRVFSAFKHDSRHQRWFLIPLKAGEQTPVGCSKGVVRYYDHIDVKSNLKVAQVLENPTADDFQCALSTMDGDMTHGGASGMLKSGMYEQEILGVLQHYPREQIMVLWFEIAMENILQTMRDIEEFLGLPHSNFIAKTELNPAGHIRIRAPIKDKFQEMFAPLLAFLGLAHLLGSKLCDNTGIECGGHSKTPMRPDSRTFIDNHFAAANTKLLHLLHHPPSPQPPGLVLPQASSATHKNSVAPPSKWPFLCECIRPSSTQEVEKELCFGEAALVRIAGLGSSGDPTHRSRPVRPMCLPLYTK